MRITSGLVSTEWLMHLLQQNMKSAMRFCKKMLIRDLEGFLQSEETWRKCLKDHLLKLKSIVWSRPHLWGKVSSRRESKPQLINQILVLSNLVHLIHLVKLQVMKPLHSQCPIISIRLLSRLLSNQFKRKRIDSLVNHAQMMNLQKESIVHQLMVNLLLLASQ